ncbi:MAG TPA: CDP-alcohol phosphatidyltransferase family protein [Micromonosporaceae bacterium]|nr:CDP-alcohol phosphatidyltransferase family protein [Micromonosporaceae bacterium]
MTRRRQGRDAGSAAGTAVIYAPAQAWPPHQQGWEDSATPLAPVSPALPPQSLDDAVGGDGLVPETTRLAPETTQGAPETTPLAIPLLPGERTPRRLAKFTLVNACTLASLMLGLVAVFFAIAGDFRLAALALLGCVVFDGCDGALARRLGVASPFGAQMDSLADLSSFGVAAGIVVYHWLLDQGASPAAAAPACAIIVACAAIRLARFNVSPKNGRYFCGVPTTMVAAVLALDILIGPELPPSAHVAAVAVYGLAMVTSFPYAKLRSVLRLPPWVWVVPAICAMLNLPLTFGAVVAGYLLSGPVLWLRRRPVATA